MNENGNSNGNGTWGKVLTGKQRLFIDHWFETRCNGTEAARLAGYCQNGKENDWASRASQLLRNVKVLEEINRRWAAHGVTSQEVMSVLARQMRSGVADFHTEHGIIDWDAIREGGAGIVQEVVQIVGQSAKVKLYSAQRAAELIGKSLGMFKESRNISGNLDITSLGEQIGGVAGPEHDRAISSLAAALGSILPGSDSGESGAMDAAERTAVASTAESGG